MSYYHDKELELLLRIKQIELEIALLLQEVHQDINLYQFEMEE